MAAEEPTKIGICPHCTNFIFKDAVFNSEATFSMRCPHCNKTLKVIVKTKIEIVILPVDNAATKPKKTGPGVVAVILVLYLPTIAYQIAKGMDNVLDIFA